MALETSQRNRSRNSKTGSLTQSTQAVPPGHSGRPAQAAPRSLPSSQSSQSYVFQTREQWTNCLHDRTEVQSIGRSAFVDMMPPYAMQPSLFSSGASHTPFFSPNGDFHWCHETNHLLRIRTGIDLVESMAVPPTFVNSVRTIATSDCVWSLDHHRVIHLLELETRALVRSYQLDPSVLDIAVGEKNFVYAFAESAAGWELSKLDCDGRCVPYCRLPRLGDAVSFVVLPGQNRLIVLTQGECAELHGYSLDTGLHRFSIPTSRYSHCFHAEHLAGNPEGELLLFGKNACGESEIVVVDTDGQQLQVIPWISTQGSITGMAVRQDRLMVSSPLGVHEFTKTDEIAIDQEPIVSSILTPVLRSPKKATTKQWLRADVHAHLPNGTRLDVVVLSTDNQETKRRMETVWRDKEISVVEKWQSFLAEPELRQQVIGFASDASRAAPTETFSVPLFDVSDEFIWLGLQLSASALSQLPSVSKLDVLCHSASLMDHLPSIYQRDAAQPGSFLRALVGVLETSTQSLDATIQSLGSFIQSSNDSHDWLDYMASWLGLPWNENMELVQKQRLLESAQELANYRGTRCGLVSLLRSIVGDCDRFRITDLTADFGFAILGGSETKHSGSHQGPPVRGCQLPALLGGSQQRSMSLGSQARLGQSSLSCKSPIDPAAPFCGRIRIEIAASALERIQWESWLQVLVQEVIPLGTSIDIRWVGPRALEPIDPRLDLELKPLPSARLGSDAVTGQSILPDPKSSTHPTGPSLPVRLK